MLAGTFVNISALSFAQETTSTGNGLTVIDTLSREKTVQIVLIPSKRGSALKTLPMGANSFLFELTLFQKGFCVEENSKSLQSYFFCEQCQAKKTTFQKMLKGQ